MTEFVNGEEYTNLLGERIPNNFLRYSSVQVVKCNSRSSSVGCAQSLPGNTAVKRGNDSNFTVEDLISSISASWSRLALTAVGVYPGYR